MDRGWEAPLKGSLCGRCDCLKMIIAVDLGRLRTPGHWSILSPGEVARA